MSQKGGLGTCFSFGVEREREREERVSLGGSGGKEGSTQGRNIVEMLGRLSWGGCFYGHHGFSVFFFLQRMGR